LSIARTLIPEFDREMANTRRALERIPDERMSWQPHARSMTLGGIATHLSQLPRWVRLTLEQPELDLTVFDDEVRTALPDRSAVLERFDDAVSEARASLEGADDATMLAGWTLRRADTVFFNMPRTAVYRGFIMNHIIHHRGQLTVYLRLIDVAVPGMYGPSADEQ